MMTKAKKVQCKRCKSTWYYVGYPAYTECPYCKHKNWDFLEKEIISPHCGDGIIRQHITKIFKQNINTDSDQEKLAKLTLEKPPYNHIKDLKPKSGRKIKAINDKHHILTGTAFYEDKILCCTNNGDDVITHVIQWRYVYI